MAADRIPLPGIGLARLAHLGLNVDQVLRLAHIPPGVHQQARLVLTTRQYFALWSAIETLAGDALVGLRIGGQARPDQFDPASFAALHSANFGEALQRLARYKRLSCPEDIRMVQTGDQVAISFHWLRAQGQAPHVLTDAAFAAIQLLLHSGTGQALAPLRLELSRPPGDTSGHAQHYARHFGCEVRMGAVQDVLVYPRATLDAPFATGNPDLVAALLPGLDQQLDAAAPQALDQQVKSVLVQMMHGERPSIEATARHLCLSPRTLQRRLTEMHTSYQSILDEVRLDVAQKLLAHTPMDPGEIAFYLGFEEVNSFQRAFHKWQGMTPTQWRMAARSP
jgi:AraC-like DNA-binding protein